MRSGCEQFDQTFEEVTYRAVRYRGLSSSDCINTNCPLILHCNKVSGSEIENELLFRDGLEVHPLITALRRLSLSLSYNFTVEKNDKSAQCVVGEYDYVEFQNRRFINLVVPFFRRMFL